MEQAFFHTLPVSEEKGKSAAAGSGAADFFDERRGRIALQQGEAYDFTAAPLHRFPAYDAIHGPVPAFDQHVWLYGLDELRGRILVEPDHEIHAFQMRQHKGPHRIRIDGPVVALAPPVDPKNPKPIVDKNGCRVEVIYKTVSVYDASGKLLKQESIIDYTKENIRGAYASLDNFIRRWSAEDKKETIRELLRNQGIDLEAIKADQGMSDVDDFDFICHVAFDKKPLTRRERAENVKKKDFLNRYSGAARTVLEALLDKYMNTGIYEIEKTEILRLDPFMQMGKPQKIASYFGGKDGYLKAVKELEQAIYDGGAA